LQHTYTDGVLRAGGLPVLLAPIPDQHIPRLLDRLDGLILSGGGDVDPSRYGGRPHDGMYGIDFDRDEFEIELVKAAAERRIPVLAICRGLQVVNVALGGTLIEDIPTEIGSADHTVIGHKVFNGHQHVTLEPGCLVAKVVDATDLEVNSIHHQAVRDLAPGFRAVGWADDGVIEAIQHEDPSWPLLAVQWHPEYLGDVKDPASRALFKSLVESAALHQTVV
jgi:putative glutamine amidotransferase